MNSLLIDGLLCCAMGLTPLAARADAAPVGLWLDLRVSRCEAVTFKPSAADAAELAAGKPYRTARIGGQVVDAGLQPYDASQPWLQDWADKLKSQLPAQGSQQVLVLQQWDPRFCRKAVGQVIRFKPLAICDTLPRVGACLAPHLLVEAQAR